MSRILVVEEEAIIARDIFATLKDLGYEVAPPVATGQGALDAMATQRPDLVLMDVSLQGAMDGVEAAGRIRDQHGTPVVYLTSFSDDATIARATQTGAYGYLLKPFSDRDLRTAIEVALQKRTIELRLAERERWFATTLRSIGDAVIATDVAQRITFMNAVAERVTGWKAGDAEGKNLLEVLRLVDEKTGEPVASPLDRAFLTRFAVELGPAAALAPAAGGRRAVDDSAAPILDERGNLLGGVVVFRDVTDKRLLEARLVQTERLAAIGTLSAGMAHEVNNPLQYVLTNVAFAADAVGELHAQARAQSDAASAALARRLGEIADALGDARDGGARVQRIVHDLKKFGRLDVAKRAPLELCTVLDAAIRMSENVVRHHARVKREYGITPYVDANESELAQVFINLLVNAAQALGEGQVDAKQIVVATYTDDAGRAVCEVRDAGPGIPAEIQRRVFDPFFTTKPVGQGSGLGLSIAHSIVAAAGGEISVESQVGRGATFRVSLPPARTQTVAPPPVAAPAAGRRGRVLIVDDEPAIARALGRVLSREHDVFAVGDARDALARIAHGERFDVILCDLMMPAMTGPDFFATLHGAQPDLATRIVFLTGGAFTPQTEAFLRATSNTVLTKPVDPAVLRRIIADLVARPS